MTKITFEKWVDIVSAFDSHTFSANFIFVVHCILAFLRLDSFLDLRSQHNTMMMMFSRIAGSVSRSARSRLQSNRCSGFRHWRIPAVTESCLEAKTCVLNRFSGFGQGRILSVTESCSEAKPCVGADNQIVYGKLFENNGSVLASPTTRRLFSTESPEQAHEQKSEFNGRDTGKIIDIYWMPILFPTFILWLRWLVTDFEYGAQISFQEFSNLFRERGLVDHIEVSMGYNIRIAHVYVRSLRRTTERKKDDHPHRYEKSTTDKICRYKYYFELESTINEFEKKLKEVQTSLGIEPQDFVPIVYKLEGNWGYYSHKYVW